MSKRGYISRYHLIINKLKAKPYSTYEELQNYIDNHFQYLRMLDDDLYIGFSKRTLQRDIREIRNFGVHIEFSIKSRGYFIRQSEMENMNFQCMMEAFDMLNYLNLAQDLAPFVHLEKRRPQVTENLYGLLVAIKNRFQIKFSYHKFWEDEPTQRMVEPYALKEFKNRWYILANDTKINQIRTFALDRLNNLEITRQKFDVPETYDAEKSFQYCFGIIVPGNEKPQEIELSFDPFQGKYIKTLPLHETQEILIDNEDELRIKLKLFITDDLIMELLSYSDSMMVLKPKSLARKLKEAHKKAFAQYEN